MYDPFLGRFVQADTIIPEAGKAGAYDRYAYTNNNPVKYTDPSGHMQSEYDGGSCSSLSCLLISTPITTLQKYSNSSSFAKKIRWCTIN